MRVRAIAAVLALATGAVVSAAGRSAAVAPQIPRPDHIVIAVEENHAETKIIDNPDAPFITGLASTGANMTQSYGVTHPSQPNYLALFSGSTQAVTDDGCPKDFGDTANLASNLTSAGRSFTGYSEDLPSAGYTGCGSGGYARKHSPWVDFSNVAATANQPFSAFPTDYSKLPAVSFVIPNLTHDMHDGTVAQGDTWLQQNLGDYIAWAKTHNSLFVLTFDEDDYTENNQIATVFSGANVVPGSYDEPVTHYNVLSTIASAVGVPAPGSGATAAPITDIWTTTLASDLFDRTVTNGWGSADTGGTYSYSGPPTSFAVVPGAGRVKLARRGTMYGSYLNAASSASTDLLTSLSLDKRPAGGPVYAYVVGRRISAGTDYQARMLVKSNGAVQLFLVRDIGATKTMLTPKITVPGVTVTAGRLLSVRLQVTGTSPTTVRAKVWLTTEPSTWTATATDSTPALQTAGGLGLIVDLDRHATNQPVTASVRTLSAQPVG